jgi:hypothetical protein
MLKVPLQESSRRREAKYEPAPEKAKGWALSRSFQGRRVEFRVRVPNRPQLVVPKPLLGLWGGASGRLAGGFPPGLLKATDWIEVWAGR